MNITWHGQSCFSIEEKVDNNSLIIVMDPYSEKATGLKLPKLKADIITVSHQHEDHNNTDGVVANETEPMIFERPGEYERLGVFIQGIGSYHDKEDGAKRGKSVMFVLTVAGVRILHLGDLGTELSDKQIEKIGDVDILLVPIGGVYTLDGKEAAEIVTQIEPRIVIPMHYKIDGLTTEIENLDKFRKAIGDEGETLPKLKIAKKDLLAETTKVIVLERN